MHELIERNHCLRRRARATRQLTKMIIDESQELMLTTHVLKIRTRHTLENRRPSHVERFYFKNTLHQ